MELQFVCQTMVPFYHVFIFTAIRVYFLSSLKVIITSMENYPKTPRNEWVRAWPGQAVLAVTQFYWTAYMHEAIKGGKEVKFSLRNRLIVSKF